MSAARVSRGLLIIVLVLGSSSLDWQSPSGIRSAHAGPTQAQWRVGIDCGCARDGRYVAPDPGRAIDLSQSTSSVQDGLSPHGKYRLVAEPAVVVPGENITLSVWRLGNDDGGTSDDTLVLNEQFPGGAWGFSPDDDRFVVHWLDVQASGTWHEMRVYDLAPAGGGAAQSLFGGLLRARIATLGGARVRFSGHGRYLLWAGITYQERLFLSVYDVIAGSEVYSVDADIYNPPDDVSVAGWGFSPDVLDATFAVGWETSSNSVTWKVVNLRSGQLIHDRLATGLPREIWWFSPCGDLFAINDQARQPNPDLRFYSSYDGEEVDAAGALLFADLIVENDWHTVYYHGTSGEGVPIFENLVDRACPGEPDSDGDGVPDSVDNCPDDPNPEQADGDGDGVGDICDNCPEDSNAQQQDADTDGTGDVCELPVGETDVTQPNWPAGSILEPLALAETSVVLGWSAAADDSGVIASYEMLQDNVSLVIVDGETFELEITGLDPLTPYWFAVEASDAAGNWSSGGPGVRVDTVDTTPPVWPAGAAIGVRYRTASSLSFDWPAASDNDQVSSYPVYLVEPAGNTRIGTVYPYGTLKLSLGCLDPGTGFEFLVVARDRAGNTTPGPSAVITTLAGAGTCESGSARLSVDSSGAQAEGLPPGSEWAAASGGPVVSGDGRIVAFDSVAVNLVAGDTNSYRLRSREERFQDVFVHDRDTGATTRVSVSSSGEQAALGHSSYAPGLSADGRYVAFYSTTSDLDPAEGAYWDGVYVHDRSTQQTERVNVSSSGEPANWRSQSRTPTPVSDDGRFVAFSSCATNLAPETAGLTPRGCGSSSWRFPGGFVYVHDRSTGETTLVSKSSIGEAGNNDSWAPAMSGDGRYVAFISVASNFFAGDGFQTPDVFVHDRQTGITELVSVSSAGVPGDDESGEASWSDMRDGRVDISADGRFVVFASAAGNFATSDQYGNWEIFVRDRELGTTERVARPLGGVPSEMDAAWNPSISRDGRVVSFGSGTDNLVPDDSDGGLDLFVVDRLTGSIERACGCKCGDVSYAPSPDHGGWTVPTDLSGDGSLLLFSSEARNMVPNMGDTNRSADVFAFGWDVPPPPAEADLGIGMTALPDPAFEDRDLRYQLTVRNWGPVDASGVEVVWQLPTGTDYYQATPSQGSCTQSIDVTCNLGDLALGLSATVEIIVQPRSQAASLETLASVSATSPIDPNDSNDTASLALEVLATPGPGDVDGDGDIDESDLDYVLSARGTPVERPNDPRDLDGDGFITALDARKLVVRCSGSGCASQAGAPGAVRLEILPLQSEIGLGETLELGVVVSGLGVAVAPSVAVFDFDLDYDPALLSLVSVSFGDAGLGSQLDLSGLGSWTDVGYVAGGIDAFELSPDTVADVDALQVQSFVLLRVALRAQAEGVGAVGVSVQALGDALGNPIALPAVDAAEIDVVPEPAGVLLQIGALVALALVSRARARAERGGAA